MLPLAGYDVRYGRRSAIPALLLQIPRLAARIRDEHNWLIDTVKRERIDAVISDNRYGLWHRSIPTVILTHQAGIRSGFGDWADRLLRALHYRLLGRFSECWIVDTEGPGNLGGSLSHPSPLPARARYLGWISQFLAPAVSTSPADLLILLSGPEPQRSILSDRLWEQAGCLTIPVVFVEGSASATRSAVPGHIRHYARTGGAALQALLEGASLVVCRSGYSSLMDLVLLRKKAILIPTPGQPEQEYLADRLREGGMFYAAPQKGFSLDAALSEARYFPFRLPDDAGAHEAYKGVLDDWLRRIGDE